MICGESDGDTTQQMRPQPDEAEKRKRFSSRLDIACEVGIRLARKKERYKMLEEMKAAELDRIDILWTELEKKRQRLDDSQAIVDALRERLEKEKEDIANLEGKLESLDSVSAPRQVKQLLVMVQAQNIEERFAPPEGPSEPNRKEVDNGKSQGEMAVHKPPETVAVQHVFEGVETRGRGRPPKSAPAVGQKRGRGRPRKHPVKVKEEPAAPIQKRGRGRPRKVPVGGASGADGNRTGTKRQRNA